MKFYSKEEIVAIKAAIRNGEKLSEASKRLSKEFGRSEASVYLKLLSVGKSIGLLKPKTRRKSSDLVKQQPSNKGITLKNGFVFDFKPQRAEMYQDHVRIYF